MEFISRLFVKSTEWRNGQTMTEYAMILAAIAIVVFVTYQVLGQSINSLVNKVDALFSAS
jgi:Flp pilus assembly pilin Flp